jgi:predicted RNA-binding Zn ribbon-like protein
MDAAERDLLLQVLWTQDETDALATAEGLRDWLGGLGLLEPGEPVSESDVRLARHVRAATRGLCAVNSGLPVDPRTTATFEELNALAPLRVTVAPEGGLDIVAGGQGVPRALASLLAIAHRATVTGEFARFKACKGCGWAYYDESKNASKKWCDMGLCGARSKMKAYRARKAGTA